MGAMELRTFTYLDVLQPQLASFLETVNPARFAILIYPKSKSARKRIRG